MIKYINILKHRSFTTSQELSSTTDNQSKSNRSLYVPRDKIDETVLKLALLQKQINKVKATLTQRKIKKESFDSNRISLSLDKIGSSLENLLRYSSKASIIPKVKKDVSEEEGNTSPSDTSPI